MRTWILLVLLTALGVAAPTYKLYVNSRYGYRLEVPSDFRVGRAPENDDGRVLTSPDGKATLTVFGSNNALDQTLAAAMAAAEQEMPEKVAYRQQGKNWFVLSWNHAGRISYRKVFLGPGSLAQFVLVYPASQKQRYQAVVTHLEASFKPGDLGQAH